MGFLNTVLRKTLIAPITQVSLEDPHLHKEYKEDKLSIMDVCATLDTGECMNIEIQIANKHDIQKRSLYYWSKLYASQMQEGLPYRALQKAITINVLDFILYPNQEHFTATGVLWDVEQGFCMSDDIEIHYIELPKLITKWKKEQVNPWQDVLVRWLLLLSANEDQHLTKTLEAIAMEQDKILQQAIQKWDNMSHNQQFRREYEAREKVLLDEKAAVAHAKIMGRQEGLEQGRAEGITQLIESMSKQGLTIDEIAKLTGLHTTEIHRLLRIS